MITKEFDPNIKIDKLQGYIRAVEKIGKIEWDQPHGTTTSPQGVTVPIMGPNYPRFLFDTNGVFSLIGDYANIVEEMGKQAAPEDMSLLQAEALLTYIFRGELFCDGHIDKFIQNGKFLRALYRVEELVTGVESKIVFHAPSEWYGFLSNWYKSDFCADGRNFCSAEQYIMYHKAMLFKDQLHADMIMQTKDQGEIQQLGRKVTPFDPIVWDGHKQIILYKGLMAKFSQNEVLRGKLIDTGARTLVEGARTDHVYANGLNRDDPNRYDEKCWKGKNLLGYTLMEVRDELKTGAK